MIKKCAYCGEEFEPICHSQIYCKRPHYMTCPICGKVYLVTNNDKLKFPPTACSYACRAEVRKRTSLERYGCVAPGNNPEAREKAKATMVERYGAEYTLCSDELKSRVHDTWKEKYGADNPGKCKEVIDKRMKTNRERYGDTMPFNSKETYEKRKQSIIRNYGSMESFYQFLTDLRKTGMIDKYGVSSNMQVPEMKEHFEQVMLEKYGYRCAFQVPEFKEKSEQTMMKRYGVRNAAHSEELTNKAIQTCIERYGSCARISKINLEVSRRLTELGIEHKMERCFHTRWYDIELVNRNIFLEIDPTYTHNLIGNHWGSGYDMDYHKMKSDIAKEHGYRCIHIFDFDNFELILKMLSDKRRVYARKCKIKEVEKSEADEFLNQNHLQGSCRGQDIRLGLYERDELIQIMTFGRPRYSKKYDYELLRLCTRSDIKVIGGSSKLFKYAVQNYYLNNVISYCDYSKFTGDVYLKLGMKFVRHTEPQEIWSKEDKKISANLLRQRGYDQLFGTNYGKGTDNEELMLQNGWLPVSDCGQLVFEYKR